MKKSIAKIFACIFSVLMLFSFTVLHSAAADYSVKPLEFGDYAGDSDYDFGDYDYGGNDYDFGDSNDDYDYGSSDDEDYDYNDDSDYDNGGFYFFGPTGGSGNSGGGSSMSGFTILLGVIIVAVIIYFAFREKKKKTTYRPYNLKADADLRSMEEYSAVDPDFSAADFREKISNLYVRFQNSWQKKDISDIRPYLSDTLYAQVDRQLDNYRREFKTNHVDDISVLSVRLMGFKQEDGMDVIAAEVRTRIKDYVTDDKTGDVVRGDPKAEKFMCYKWYMAKSSGYVSNGSTGYGAKSCPHCGAPIDMNQSAVCEYCGSVLKDDSFDWVVNTIEAVSQQTM